MLTAFATQATKRAPAATYPWLVRDETCLLLHSWPDATAVALPQIITGLKRAACAS